MLPQRYRLDKVPHSLIKTLHSNLPYYSSPLTALLLGLILAASVDDEQVNDALFNLSSEKIPMTRCRVRMRIH
jgi:hypothetical protein